MCMLLLYGNGGNADSNFGMACLQSVTVVREPHTLADEDEHHFFVAKMKPDKKIKMNYTRYYKDSSKNII